MTIIKQALISQDNGYTFFHDLDEKIESFQSQGLMVEVQYTTVMDNGVVRHSALVLGSRKETAK